jgi:hypothetical protein
MQLVHEIVTVEHSQVVYQHFFLDSHLLVGNRPFSEVNPYLFCEYLHVWWFSSQFSDG